MMRKPVKYCLGCMIVLVAIGANTLEMDLAELTKRAERGDAEAQCELGINYYVGNLVPQDYKQAEKWWRKAVEQGNASAKRQLDTYIETVELEKKKAESYRIRAEQGDAEAQFQLGCIYQMGVLKDYTKSAEWHHRAAEQGYLGSQYSLGELYYEGKGVAQDYQLAEKWWRKAAEQGHFLAEFNLGTMYYSGLGVLQDYKQAAEWYLKTAEQGWHMGQYNLGLCYYTGHGVSKDYVEAYAWWNLASASATSENSSHPKYITSRDEVASLMTPQQIEEAQERSKQLLERIEERENETE